MAGIELVADKERKVPFGAERDIAGRLAGRLLDEGMICRGMINTVCFSPPLTITEADVEEIVDKFGRGLAAFGDELAREGLAGARKPELSSVSPCSEPRYAARTLSRLRELDPASWTG